MENEKPDTIKRNAKRKYVYVDEFDREIEIQEKKIKELKKNEKQYDLLNGKIRKILT